MRILHSYWTQGKENRDSCGGWLSEEANMMCWALSCLNAKKYYGNIELYTDDEGYHTLVEQMKLPYDDVHIVYNKFSPIADIPYFLWAIPKIYTYSLQKEPFIHIDGDFVFWKKLDLNQPLVFQNMEINVPLYENIYKCLKQDIEDRNEIFSSCLDAEFVSEAANMGIFGGTDVVFLSRYANNVLSFVKHYASTSETFRLNSKDINCFLEQYYFSYLCRAEGRSTHAIHSEADLSNKRLLTECTYNYPGKKSGFNHFLGSSKKQELMVDYVKYELYSSYPDYYELIHEKLKYSGIKDIYFNANNEKLNIDKLYSSFIQRLKESDIVLDKESQDEYRGFLDYKNSCLDKSKKINTFGKRLTEEQLAQIDSNTKVRLNDCYISCKRYSIPWDEVDRSEKISKPASPQVVKKNELHATRPYAVFLLTPFEHSVFTVFMDEVCAYVIVNILKREFVSVGVIAERISMLLKNQSEGKEKVLEFTRKVINNLNIYGILDFA